jgi:uncharacterized protein (TIGR00730 family)
MKQGKKPSPTRPPGPLERDFTGGGIHNLPSRFKRGTTGNKEIDQAIAELAEPADPSPATRDLVADMLVTVCRMAKDATGVADLKLANRALKELRRANKVFHPFRDTRKVVCYGSARTHPDRADYQAAVQFASRMAELGYMVITGAGEGIMGAAQQGAGRERSFGLNIALPFEQSANETIAGDPKLVDFNYFFTRKLTFVKEAHAFALFPGGFGTMDEGFELLTLIQTGKSVVQPIVLVDKPGGTYWKTFDRFLRDHLLRLGLISPEDFSLLKVTDNVDEAVAEITRFYHVFHSYRYVGPKTVIRLNQLLPAAALEELNRSFLDLAGRAGFTQCAALPQETDEPEIASLPRLVFNDELKRYGRLRQLIDAINRSL